MNLNLNATEIFQKNYKSKKKVVVNRGGTRSSKTYSLTQLFIVKALTEKNKRFIVSRVSINVMKSSVIRDFHEILEAMNLTEYFKFNHTHSYFKNQITNSTIEFISTDDPAKWRGLEANYFWFNEADGIKYEFFQQAIMRLSRKSNDGIINQFFLDFNPSNPYSWVRKHVENSRSDVEIIISSYKDNPFLTSDVIEEIERYKTIDYDYWLCYATGEYGEVKGGVFKNWNLIQKIDKNSKLVAVGLDFGYSNDPTTAVKVWVNKSKHSIYLQQLFYKKGLTNPDIADELKRFHIGTNDLIIADSAEPKSIEELRRLGYRNIKGVKKGKGSIQLGIDILKRYTLQVVQLNSQDLIVELQNYTWAELSDGSYANKPKDDFNHCIDAIRYVALECLGIKPSRSGIIIR